MTSVKKIKVALLALVAALVIAIPTSAFAATITVTADEEMNGASYKAYQIFSGTYAPADGDTPASLSDVQWADDVDKTKTTADGKTFAQAIEAVLGAETSDAAKAAEALNDSNALDFAAAIEPFLTGGTALASNDGKVFTTGTVADGYWLVKTENPGTTVKDDRPGAYTKFVTGLIGGTDNIDKAAKASVPEVDKGVLEDSTANFAQIVAEGDIDQYTRAGDFDYEQVIHYYIKGTLPTQYNEFNKGYYYKFTDTMSQGLKLVGDNTNSVHVYKYLNGTKGDEITTGFTKTWANNVLTVEFANLKDVIPEYVKGLEIVVLYDAQLTGEHVVYGVAGNPNDVYLTYSNNPNKDADGDSTGETPRKYAVVYTFGVQETKHKEGEQSTTLVGAEFYLLNDKGEYAIISFAGADRNAGTFLRWGTKAEATDKNAATYSKLITKSDGKLNVKGLDAGKYIFREVKAPVGYNLPTGADADFDITISDKLPADSEVQAAAGNKATTAEVNSDGYATGFISNTQGSTLPSTGGIGTTIFYIVGAALILAAAITMVVRRRNAAAQQ